MPAPLLPGQEPFGPSGLQGAQQRAILQSAAGGTVVATFTRAPSKTIVVVGHSNQYSPFDVAMPGYYFIRLGGMQIDGGWPAISGWIGKPIGGVAAGTSVSLQTQGASQPARPSRSRACRARASGRAGSGATATSRSRPRPRRASANRVSVVSCAYHQSGSTWGCNISTGQPVGTLYGFGMWAKVIVVPYIPGSRPVVNWTTGTGGNNLGWSAIIR